MKVRWTRPATRNLVDIHDYLSQFNSTAALKLVKSLRAQAQGLGSHPQKGRQGRVNGTRELVISGTDFIIAYQITENSVDILAVRHAARDWPARLDR
ncbi:type II toxin-antitoxin system RelE/ParE family toxin [Nitrospirillum sp. BR 11164]|uniref:type II toxin-antitoxin system RelE/ParE family toxin n=1 Tax=Nitrospirillum sp. BR 11164 TaxID=3104324 RepID=UPI002AFF2239|nr:type II toxin-antitoxin system RelE/ParE family toxin [Nitrospirillum sp. BR 11164]MEA1651590.1 type II toxin-antitoxin system RelE/ParE family toxin [Nitrospirillum sp. BR 11164]